MNFTRPILSAYIAVRNGGASAIEAAAYAATATGGVIDEATP